MGRRLTMLLLIGLACDEDQGAGDSAATDGSGGVEDDSGGGEPVDADAVVARALRFGEELEQITAASQPSQHGLADTVHVWIDPAATATYRALDPATDEASEVEFAPGTLFVKQHLDAEGADVGLTIMFRGPAGYAPDSADWWWGRTNAAGAVQDEGQVGFCIGCHAGANAEAYVFGVAATNQTAD
jgi:hypothetical protein